MLHTSSVSWQSLFRNKRLSLCLLGIIIISLAVRTAAFNYDLSLSVRDNAYNHNPFYTPVKKQPIATKKPRAMASITLPMAQSHSDIRKDAPVLKVSLIPFLHTKYILTLLCCKDTYLLAIIKAAPPDLCLLHAVFRI